MSRTWAGGSTTAWRRTRTAVLNRDQWTCQLCHQRIPRGLPPTHPNAAQVHHTRSRELVGDDPQWLVAAHRQCNLAAGEPGRHDPPATTPTWLATRIAQLDPDNTHTPDNTIESTKPDRPNASL